MKKQYYTLVTCVLLAMVLTGCGNVANKPDPTRQAWRDSWGSLPDAKAGKLQGLHRSFQAAHDQVEMPFANGGEDAEAIAENLQAILDAVGDQVFSEALQREVAETRSAVRDCMFERSVKKNYPMTHKLLCEAPHIKWPSRVAYERSWTEMGQVAPDEEIWKP